MKIMVAGGAGYIGSVLVPMLQEHGYEVTVVDLLWFGNHLPEGTYVIQRDLFTLDVKDLEGFDQVIFLAGLSSDPMAEFNPAMNFVQNGALPSYLAFISKKAGVRRFIYGSSCSIYGYTVNEPYDEESPTTCAYPYGISKLEGERGVLQLESDTFSTIALRMGTASGHSARMRFDLLINTMFKAALTQKRITVNNPSIWRPIIDVRDAASAYTQAVQADYGISGTFNIAYDNYTVGQVGDMVREQLMELSDNEIAITVNNVQDFRNYKVTTEKAQTHLGFSPKYSIDDIVVNLYNNLDSYDNFSDERYYNVKVFRKLEQDRYQTNPYRVCENVLEPSE